MSEQHTQGPLEFGPDAWGTFEVYDMELGAETACNIQNEADARLYAAAPKLLKALEVMLSHFRSQHGLLLQLGAPDFVAVEQMAASAIEDATKKEATK